jgi:hypothetical protein
VNVYFSIKGFEGRSSLFTWLHRITVNLFFEFLRKRKATGLKQSALKARLFRIRRRLLAATTQI